jgi:hypothetical protein
MAWSDEQKQEYYKVTTQSARDIKWIRERLEKGDKRLDDCDDRMDKSSEKLGELEAEQKLLTGKLGFVVVILSVCFTAAIHAIGWIVSHFWKS